MLIESYGRSISTILKIYNRICLLDSELLNYGNININQIKGWSDELKEGRFRLCIAGQMNSGKSTLLNALLFGMPVLPVDDQVMTSAVTVIEHVSRHPQGMRGARITFYSNEEFKQIKDGLTGNDEARQRLDDAVEEARNRGVVKVEILGRDPVELEGYEQLVEYIAPVENGKPGRYAPFVKEVTLFGDHPLLEHLVIVDTPGINDPNRVREELTEQCIRDAHAVVYVSYAGQPFSTVDVDFINRYMIHVAPSHQIVAFNKIDGQESETELRRWVDSLRTDRSEGLRQMISGESTVVYVSALGALLSQPNWNLTEEDLWYRDDLQKKGFLDPSKNGIEALRQVIDNCLLHNGAGALLDSHRHNIKEVLRAIEQPLRDQEREAKASIAALSDENYDLTKFVEKLESYPGILDTISARISMDIEKAIGERFSDLTSPLSSAIHNLEERFSKEKNIGDLERNGAFHAKAVLDEYNSKVKFTFLEAVDMLRVDVSSLCESFKKEANQMGLDDELSIGEIVDSEKSRLARDMDVSVDEEFIIKIEKAVHDSVGFFRRYIVSYVSDGPMEDMRNALLDCFHEELKKLDSEFYGNSAALKLKLGSFAQPVLGRIQARINESNARIRNQLLEAKFNHDNSSDRLVSARKNFECIHNNLSKINSLRTDIEKALV